MCPPPSPRLRYLSSTPPPFLLLLLSLSIPYQPSSLFTLQSCGSHWENHLLLLGFIRQGVLTSQAWLVCRAISCSGLKKKGLQRQGEGSLRGVCFMESNGSFVTCENLYLLRLLSFSSLSVSCGQSVWLLHLLFAPCVPLTSPQSTLHCRAEKQDSHFSFSASQSLHCGSVAT